MYHTATEFRRSFIPDLQTEAQRRERKTANPITRETSISRNLRPGAYVKPQEKNTTKHIDALPIPLRLYFGNACTWQRGGGRMLGGGGTAAVLRTPNIPPAARVNTTQLRILHVQLMDDHIATLKSQSASRLACRGIATSIIPCWSNTLSPTGRTHGAHAPRLLSTAAGA